MDAMGPISYCAQNGLLDASLPKGALNYWKAHFVKDLSDDCIDAILDAFAKCPSPMSQLVIEHFHGAASRVPVQDTACAMRITGFNVVIISQWTDPERQRPLHHLVPRDIHVAAAVPRHDAIRELSGYGRSWRSSGRRLRRQLRAPARAEGEVRPGERVPRERQHPSTLTRRSRTPPARDCSPIASRREDVYCPRKGFTTSTPP